MGIFEYNAEKAKVNKQEEDEHLIKKFLQTGDNKIFECLIKKHLATMQRILYSVFNGNSDDILDARQEILIKLYSDLRVFQFKASFNTFFYRYVKNKAIDILRKLVREKNKIIKLNDRLKEKQVESPEDMAINKITKNEIMNLLLKLKDDDRQIIMMKEIEGYSIIQIANVMNMPEGTIKSRLFRSRERLVQLMGEKS